MSNGSEIGGVIGGAIGAYFGGADGARYGYAIGSAIGGYVDPQRNYGPRLTDASSQTSTVGGVIPFGFGIFTTAGNLIWADDLKEHKKSERAGKGGGQKNITYTYTRSYAIGVCEGVVYRYMWIKRNGKLVYAHDAALLGAAMGWTGQQIADLAEASRKFMEKCTIHYGTGDQLPDATITAVEGVGNVSAFRDLSYIAVRNDDLTNTSGAVPQYEFCVQTTGMGYVTTTPYVLESQNDYRALAQLPVVKVDSTTSLTGTYATTTEVEFEVADTRLPESIYIEGFASLADSPAFEVVSVRTVQEVRLGRYASAVSTPSIEIKTARVILNRHSPNNYSSQAGSITFGVDTP